MTQILIDAITNLAMHNGVMRIECAAVGADGQQRPSGTLIIPGLSVPPVLQTLTSGTQELLKKLVEQQATPRKENV